MKRILLFIATNLAVVLVLGVVLNIVFSMLGIDRSSITGLLIFCAVFGFGGAFISLLISKWMAKRAYNVQIIDQPRNELEHWLLTTVTRQAQQAGIGMPEVGIYDSHDMNAFATGASRNSSLVAVSTGLMHQMSRDEAEAVLAHEISHIANGDMVTMTLLQGVVNTFVMFFARIIANLISSAMNKDNEEGGGLGGIAYFGVVMVLELVFGMLASIIVMWFSRYREYRADEGSARLVGKDKMIAALQRLGQGPQAELDGSLAAFGINGQGKSELFMSHPPLEKRIQSLRNL